MKFSKQKVVDALAEVLTEMSGVDNEDLNFEDAAKIRQRLRQMNKELLLHLETIKSSMVYLSQKDVDSEELNEIIKALVRYQKALEEFETLIR